MLDEKHWRAVINYKDGLGGIANIFKSLNMIIGKFTERFLINIDRNRAMEMNVKSSQKSKSRRKKLRAIRKGYQDKATEVEGETCLHLNTVYLSFCYIFLRYCNF